MPAWSFLQDEAIDVLEAQGFPEGEAGEHGRDLIRAYVFVRLLSIIDTDAAERSNEEQAAYEQLREVVRSSRAARAANALAYWESLESGNPCWSGGNPESGVYVPPNVFVSLFCELSTSDDPRPNQIEVYQGQGAAEAYDELLSGNGQVEMAKLVRAMDWFTGRDVRTDTPLFDQASPQEQSYREAMDFFREIRRTQKNSFLLSLVNPSLSPEAVIQALLVLGTTVWDVVDFTVIGNRLRSQSSAAARDDPNLEALIDGQLLELAIAFMGRVLGSDTSIRGCGFNDAFTCRYWNIPEGDPDYVTERYDGRSIPLPDTASYIALRQRGASSWQVTDDVSPVGLGGEGILPWAVPVRGSSDLNGELGGASTRRQEPLPAGVDNPYDLSLAEGEGLATRVVGNLLVHAPVNPDGTRADDEWMYSNVLKYQGWDGSFWNAFFVDGTFLHVRDASRLVDGFAQVAGYIRNDGGLIIQDGTYTDGYRYCRGWDRFVSRAPGDIGSRDAGTVDGRCILLSRDFDVDAIDVGDRIEIGGQIRRVEAKVTCEGQDLNNTGPLIDLFVGQLYCDEGNPGYEPLNPATTDWNRTALIVDEPIASFIAGENLSNYGPSPWFAVRVLEDIDTCAEVTTGIARFGCRASGGYNPRDFAYCPRFGDPTTADADLNPAFEEPVFDDDVWSGAFAPLDCFYSPMVRYLDTRERALSALFVRPAQATDDVYSVFGESLTVNRADGIIGNDNIPSSQTIARKGGYRVSLVRDVAHGSLTLNEDGSFTYVRGTAAADNAYGCAPAGEPYCGPDEFEYRVCADRDGRTDCDTAVVTLRVRNEAPRVYDVAVTETANGFRADYQYHDAEGDAESGTEFTWFVNGNPVAGVTGPEYTPASAVEPDAVSVAVTPQAARGIWPDQPESVSSADGGTLTYRVGIDCTPDYLEVESGEAECTFTPHRGEPVPLDEPFDLVVGLIDGFGPFTIEPQYLFICSFDSLPAFGDRGDASCTATVTRNPNLVDNGGSVLMTASLWFEGGYPNGERRHTAAKRFSRAPSADLNNLSTTVSPSGSGSVSCAPAAVPDGGGATCTAQPAPGWVFAGWTGVCGPVTGVDCVLSDIDQDLGIIANFRPAVSAGVQPLGAGRAECDPAVIAPVAGASVTCTATPANGFVFEGWSGDCSGASCSLTWQGRPLNVVANFSAREAIVPGLIDTRLPRVSLASDSGWRFTTADDPQQPTIGWIPESGSANSPATPPPAGVDIIYGGLDFVLTGGAVGSSAQVTLHYPGVLQSGTQYWKYDRDDDLWYPLPPERVAISGNRMRLTITLTDGGVGDNDGLANGVIVDPGFAALNTNVVLPNVSPRPIPTLHPWALALLVGVMGMLGWWRLRIH